MPRVQRKVAARSKSATKPATKSSTKASTRSVPKSKGKAKAKVRTTQSDTNAPAKNKSSTLFFWKETGRSTDFLSPWYTAPFQDGIALKRILDAKTADEHKSLGSNVKGFDEDVWQQNALTIAERANMNKFFDGKESLALQKRLLALDGYELILASPSDRLFGIGFPATEAKNTSRENWGRNLFGLSFAAVRRRLENPGPPPADFDTTVFNGPGDMMNVYW
ncbi:hypothetical protein N0V90_008426 [Kalmusia sp. IMI 367209]|nr:hypothetical protein N0V90_008426 [Kalmusia sp. IMI 367209]